jgi:hypothetical protein
LGWRKFFCASPNFICSPESYAALQQKKSKSPLAGQTKLFHIYKKCKKLSAFWAAILAIFEAVWYSKFRIKRLGAKIIILPAGETPQAKPRRRNPAGETPQAKPRR